MITVTRTKLDTTYAVVTRILASARSEDMMQAVARNLVAAVLSKFSDESQMIEEPANGSWSSRVNDTTFYVAVDPGIKLLSRCIGELENGIRVQIILPASIVDEVRSALEGLGSPPIQIMSIESFVSLHVDWNGQFCLEREIEILNDIIDSYNNKIRSVRAEDETLIELAEY